MATKKTAKKTKTPGKTAPIAKTAAKKPAAKKTAAKKPAAKKTAAKKPVAKKTTAKKSVAKKPAATKTTAKKRPAKALVSKKTASAKPAAKKPAAKPEMRRRDGGGHLDPTYAATLRAKSREGQVRDRDDAFIGRKGRSSDALAEELGEAWVATATSGEDENEEVFNQDVPEDSGGPFVKTTGGQEFASGTDASNPKRAKREPFPRT